MKPSVGRIVHFHSQLPGWILGEREERLVEMAAVIIKVDSLGEREGIHDGTEENRFSVRLLVHGLEADFRKETVPFSPTPRDGFWSWPPRV